jgi:hypothetical protein
MEKLEVFYLFKEFFQKIYENVIRNHDTVYLCDPIVVAIAMNINLIEKHYLKHCKIEIEG